MRLKREKKGQFIVIAAMLLSIMIISVSTVIYGTVTYFRHERWEEYVTIIDSVKTGSSNVLELSLASYTQTGNSTILRDNLNQWIRDVRKAYPAFGVDLSFTLATGVRSVPGLYPNPNYNKGLNRTWDKKGSYSTADATFNINLASVGLTGYNFTASAFLKMNITDALYYSDTNEVGIRVIIEAEGPVPMINLQKANFLLFQVGGINQTFTLYRYYDSSGHPTKNPTYPALNAFVYELRYGGVSSKPSSISVVITVKDSRGVQVRGSDSIGSSRIIDY